MHTTFTMTARSDPGRVRQSNQDCVHADPGRRLFVLADGVGGRNGGEVASRLAVDTVSRSLGHSTNRSWLRPWRNSNAKALEQLSDAVLVAHQALLDQASSQPELEGMSCTVVAGIMREHECLCAAVGDSRLYRYRNGELSQITRDQTLAKQLLDEGFLEPDDARLQQYNHVLTTVLGGRDSPDIQRYQVPLERDDLLLACSDGLSGMLSCEQITAVIEGAGSLDDIAERLVRQANLAGGRDNISVVLVARDDRKSIARKLIS